MVTHHISNWRSALAQMFKVSKPGGYFIYTDLAFPRWLARMGALLIPFMGFPTLKALDEFAQTEGLRPIHREYNFFRFEGVWQKKAE